MPIPQARDPLQTAETLTEWLAARVPDAVGITIDNVRAPSATGFSSDTLLFDASWTVAGDEVRRELVLKAEPGGVTVFPEYDMAQQFRIMQTLAERTDVPVPPVHWLEEDPAVLGAPFYVMSRVEGDIPTDNPPYTLEGFLLGATPKERRRLYTTGLDAMARIHSLDWQSLGLEYVARPGPDAPGVDAELAYMQRYFEWAAEGRPQPVAEATWDWLQANRPGDGNEVRLCWGDSRISNQIFDDFNCVAVLDWEMATLCNPQLDLCWWIFLDRHFTEALGVPRPEGFPSYDDTVAQWEDATGLRVTDREWWEVFAGFRFAVVMIRVTRMVVEYGVVDPDTDMETNNLVTQLLAKMLGLPAPV